MENTDEKKKDKDDGIAWLTRPLYNLMLVSLVILYSFDKYLDHDNVAPFLQACMWIPLAIIIIANVVRFFELLKAFRQGTSGRRKNVPGHDNEESE